MIRTALILAAALALSGCWSRSEQTTRVERMTIQAQVPVPTAEGVRMLPITGTVRSVATEQSQAQSGPDTEAIIGAISQAVAGAAQAVPMPWSGIVGGAGALLTAATTGYLALKKREQMKPPAVRKG